MMVMLRFVVCLLALSVALSECAHILQKRSFVRLGCMGKFDRSKFAQLDAVCEECYELFREPDIHGRCKNNCFKNEDFINCAKALLFDSEMDELLNSVDILFGK